MKKKLSLIILATLSFFVLKAQEVEPEKPVKNVFMGTRFINLHSANVADKYELQMLIQHRFGDISGGFYDFFGLDYASMRVGFDYGITKNLNIGVGRSSYMKTFDSFIKYRFLTQSSTMPLTLTATVAGSFPAIKDVIPDAFSGFSEKASGDVQLHLAKSFKNFALQVSPGYIGTGYIPVENDSYSFFTMAFGGAVKLAKKVTFNFEYLHRFENEIDNTNPFSASIDLGTSGHLFQIMISNVQQMYDQGIITNPEGGDWTEGHLFLGFNLIRAFNFKQY
jgi:hypothetical protein